MAITPSYKDRLDRFVAGMIYDQRPRTICTRAVETVAGIGFGKVAMQGTAPNQCKVSVAGGRFLGITVLDSTVLASVPDLYPRYDDAAILQKGPIIVPVVGAVTPQAPAYFDPATGAISADSTKERIPGGVFESAATDALAKLFIA